MKTMGKVKIELVNKTYTILQHWKSLNMGFTISKHWRDFMNSLEYGRHELRRDNIVKWTNKCYRSVLHQALILKFIESEFMKSIFFSFLIKLWESFAIFKIKKEKLSVNRF